MSTSHILDQELRDKLAARKGDWQAIARDSGLSYSWLSKFCNGHIDNPGYASLKALDSALSTPTAPAAQEG